MSRPKGKQAKRRIAGVFAVWQVVTIIICLVGAVISFTLFQLGNKALAAIPEKVYLPASGLGDTVFDAQNTSYQADSDFPTALYISGTKYMTDVPAVTSAVVGNGNFYRVSDPYYIYVTTFDDGGADAAITNEVAPVIRPGAEAGDAACENVVTERGYLNGYEVTYLVYTLKVTREEKESNAVVAGYVYHDDISGKDICLCGITTVITTSGLKYARDLAAHEVGLFREVPEDDKKK